jgi:RNA polymerase sigma factor (sigma-70 family)
MTTQMNKVIQHLRRTVLRQDGCGLTDGQLLECFVSRRETAALETLVQRHAPMVWNVCRRMLHNHHDAEDAFQATFLVLVRKAASIKPRDMVGNWLYGVAHLTAMKARATTAKRRARERQVVDMPEPAETERDWGRDLYPILDQQLSRLPDKYRVAIVLCDLEGKTRKEAARHLGCPEGTLAARLARGRGMLAKRLAANGLAVSGGMLAGLLSEQAASAGVPASVMASTMKAVTLVAAGQTTTGVISANAVALLEGVLKTMLLNKLKVGTILLLMVAVVAGGMVGLSRQTQAAGGADPPLVVSPKPIEVNQGNTGLSQPLQQGPEDDRRPQANQEEDRHDTLDGLWEDIENKGGWLRFQGSTIQWHPAPAQLADLGKKQDIQAWTCRYNLTVTPMTIDIFHKDGTDHGIFVVERGALFIALGEKGKARPTSFQRDNQTTLFVLRRARAKPPGEWPEQGKGAATNDRLVVYGVLDRVDERNAVIMVGAVSGNKAESVLRLLSFALSDKQPAQGYVTREMDRAFRFVAENHPKLVNVPVRSDAPIMEGNNPLKLKDLQAGRVVSLELAADANMGLVIVGIRLVGRPATDPAPQPTPAHSRPRSY